MTPEVSVDPLCLCSIHSFLSADFIKATFPLVRLPSTLPASHLLNVSRRALLSCRSVGERSIMAQVTPRQQFTVLSEILSLYRRIRHFESDSLSG